MRASGVRQLVPGHGLWFGIGKRDPPWSGSKWVGLHPCRFSRVCDRVVTAHAASSRRCAALPPFSCEDTLDADGATSATPHHPAAVGRLPSPKADRD